MDLEYRTPKFNEIFEGFNYGDHMLILGSTGSGKTNFLLWWVLQTKLRTIVFNPIRHVEFLKICDAVVDEDVVYSDNFEKTISDVSIDSTCIIPSERYLGDKSMLTKLFSVVCRKLFFHEDRVYTAMMKQRGKRKDIDFRRKANIVLINDELMMVMEGEKLHKYHFGIIHAGRNYGISHVGLTQRHQLISKLIATQSPTKVIFWLDKYDVNALEDRIESVEYARYLDPYHFIVQKPFGDIQFYKPLGNLKVD